MTSRRDRFGIGWRPAIARELLDNLDQFDVLEVMAEHFFAAPAPAVKAMASLRAHVGLVLHGVSMGLASCRPVRPGLLARTAELFRKLRPDYWSEHLAFVRGGGYELNALAAPPRNALSVAATVANIRRATQVIGAPPLIENAASVVDPPGSDRDQLTWLIEVISASGCDLLLDLHNLFANGVNSGFDSRDFLARLPPDRIRAIHLAGGKWLGAGKQRLRLDTHTEAIPDPVFELLELAGERASRPLTVILEWDDAYPPMDRLLEQLERARESLARGRARRARSTAPRSRAEAAALESVLATLYADPAARTRRGLTTALSRSLAQEVKRMDQVRMRLVTGGGAGRNARRSRKPSGRAKR